MPYNDTLGCIILIRYHKHELLVTEEMKQAAWPTKVKEGGLRGAMGLKTDEPLQDQTSASAVVAFFKKADKKGRGMVTFAMNTNKDSAFWKKVAAGI